jgi:outer membrane protein assembly factor BamB
MQRVFLPVVCLILAARLPAADFAHYRGDGSGAPPDSGLSLVTDAAQARLLWSSQEPAPPSGRQDKDVLGCGRGGYGVPVLAGGAVYLGYWLPSGPMVQGDGSKHSSKQPVQVDADEVVICLDAASGKTRWKSVFQRRGWNYAAVYAGDGQITPCVAGGAVVMLGATGRLYCLEAATGATRWEQGTGEMAQRWERYKQDVFAGKDSPSRGGVATWDGGAEVEEELAPPPPKNPELGGSGGGGFNSTPRIFGQMVVCGLMGREVAAFDLVTGAERWRHREGLISASTCPVVWTHQGRDYLIAYPSGTCLDPVSGKILWTISGLGGAYQCATPAIAGDILISSVCEAKSKDDISVAAFRLRPDGCERLWRMADGVQINYMSPVIHRGLVYLHAKERSTSVGNSEVLLSLDLATGAERGRAPIRTENSAGGGPFALDGRIVVYGGLLFDAAPGPDGRLAPLGMLPSRAARCTFPTGADGRLYLRPRDDRCLVQCWDLVRR